MRSFTSAMRWKCDGDAERCGNATCRFRKRQGVGTGMRETRIKVPPYWLARQSRTSDGQSRDRGTPVPSRGYSGGLQCLFSGLQRDLVGFSAADWLLRALQSPTGSHQPPKSSHPQWAVSSVSLAYLTSNFGAALAFGYLLALLAPGPLRAAASYELLWCG